MFSDVGQPQQVRPLGGELTLDQVLVHWRPGLSVQTSLAGVHRPQPGLGAEPVDPVPAGSDAARWELVGDEPIAELRVVVVDVDRGVDQVRVGPVPVADRVRLPLVERLFGEAEHPAGHRDRHLVGGQVKDQREHHFGSVSRAK